MKVTAVFSGGGVKSVAQLGAWRALDEAGLAPARYVGTSFGAVIAAAIASGRPYDILVSGMMGLSRHDIAPADPLALLKGVFADHVVKADPLRDIIGRLVAARQWEDLVLPLDVIAVDLDSGEAVVYGTGVGSRDVGLHDALMASCALPLYFAPVRVGGRRLVDGGLRAVLGLDVARQTAADLVVAVHVGPGFDEDPLPGPPAPIPGLVRLHGDVIRVMMAAQVEEQVARWPASAPPLIMVRAVHEREATFAVERAPSYLEAGYEATRQALAGDPRVPRR